MNAPANPNHVEAELRRRLYDSYKNRAMIYWHLFEELSAELGAQRAEAVMKRAIRRRGEEVGRKFRPYAPKNLEGLKAAFLGDIPDEGRMFQPEVLQSSAEGLDIYFHRCPLREAWQEAGLSDELTATLCRIAAEVDYGTFEGAGFRFCADTWQPGETGCCRLHIRPGA
ncbi:L-2-amino-thiazoline-4-carboxylic acid hydrolase [Thermopirellula anaerolimosa]